MQLLEVELYFDDAGCFHASAQDVLFSRHVVLSSNAAKTVEKTTTKQDSPFVPHKISNKQTAI